MQTLPAAPMAAPAVQRASAEKTQDVVVALRSAEPREPISAPQNTAPQPYTAPRPRPEPEARRLSATQPAAIERPVLRETTAAQVDISIGRIEIHAAAPPPQRQPSAPRPDRTLSLAAYLDERRKGGRR